MIVVKASQRQVSWNAIGGAPAIEGSRRLAINLVFLIYVLALVEGPVRKWLVPELASPIYFLRDPVVIFLYAYCFHKRLIVFDGWARTWLIFAATVSLIGIVPYMLESVDGRAWLLGVRTYWLYMPLAFVIASTFDRDDLLRFFRWNIGFAIPYAALVIVQYISPPEAWVNSSIGSDAEYAGYTLVAFDIVRPYGLFTYTAQNVYFSASLVAFLISYFLIINKPSKGWVLFTTGSLAIASLSVLSGSRTIYFLIGAIVFTTLVGTNFAAGGKNALRANIFVVCSIAVAAFLFIHVYSDAYEAMQARFEHAERAEGPIQNRAIGGLLLWVIPMQEAPLIGHGIGIGAPAIGRFLGRPFLEFGETELMRNVYELGVVFGPIFVMLRFAFAAHLLVVAVRAARRGYPLFLPLAGFAAVGISNVSITHSTQVGFPFWLVAGLGLAAVQIIKPRPSPVASHEPLLKKRWAPRSQSRPSTEAPTPPRLRT